MQAGAGYTVYLSFGLRRSFRQPIRAGATTPTQKDDAGMTAKVTVEDVQRVAELAHLELKPDETAHNVETWVLRQGAAKMKAGDLIGLFE